MFWPYLPAAPVVAIFGFDIAPTAAAPRMASHKTGVS